MAISQERKKIIQSTGENLFRDDVTPDAELIGGMFPRGYISLVASQAGAGKTWFMQYLACQLSIGGRILDGMVAKSPKYKTLILAGETGKKLLDKRLAKTNWMYEPKNIRIYEAIKWAKLGIPYMINTKEGQETIAEVVEIERPTIMWLDTFISFHTADESKMNEMTSVYQYLIRMANYYNMAIVLNHHTRKKPAKSEGTKVTYTQDDVIGSSAGVRLANNVFIISVRELQGGKSIQTVKNVKSWDKKVPPFSYEFITDDDGYLDFHLNFMIDGETPSWSTHQRLNEYLSSMPINAYVTPTEAGKFVKLHPDTVRDYFEQQAKDKNGRLKKTQLMGKIVFQVK